MPVGCFVTVLNTNLGIGKLVQLTRSMACVEWFTSISQHEIREYDLESVKRAYPSMQTRCYITNEHRTEWEMGRIMGLSREQTKTGIEYDVHFAGGKAAYVPEEFVFVRCSGPPVDPIETLILHAYETPFFHDQRQKFLNSLVRQRSNAHGLTGLTSSSIELYLHQVEVARRVLEDPVQRYLLADEVGLGKTIEAGIVLRQTWLDNPSSSALVLTPPQLQAQWRSELDDKFRLDVSEQSDDEFEDSYVTLCSTDQVHHLNPKRKYDIVVIDEAQHVTSEACRLDNTVLWETCRHFAHTAPKVLLLSATPALHHEHEFLAMLHLLEPETYRLENIDAFRKRVNDRQPIGRLLLLFREGIPRPPLRRCIDTLRELFNNDPWVQEQVRMLQSYCDADEFDRQQADLIIRALRVHICETYRIYRRMLRTARSSLPSSTLSSRAANPEHPPVIEEFGFDERQTTLSHLLEEWRTTAVEAIIMTNDADKNSVMESLTDVFMILLQTAGMGFQVLQQAVECRLVGKKSVAQYQEKLGLDIANILVEVPLFRDEDTLLSTMLDRLSLEPDEGDKIGTLVELIMVQFKRFENR
jgi:ATP-dependent helicase HepA